MERLQFTKPKIFNYVYGRPDRAQTYNKAFKRIWKKRIATASLRLQRQLLRFERQEIHIEYIQERTTRLPTLAFSVSKVQDNMRFRCIKLFALARCSSKGPSTRHDQSCYHRRHNPESATTLHL